MFQQQNLPFIFSRQNPKIVGSPVVVVGATADPSKKKRSRPRKIVVDGNTSVPGATSSETIQKAGLRSTTRTIHVNIGEDIISMVMTFLQQGPPAACVLSATGNVRNVTLRRSAMGSDTQMYKPSGGHIGSASKGYNDVHEGHGFGVRNVIRVLSERQS
ncbi:AT-hook motif nuclear-localized protein 10-like [Capsicum galapagoense]